MLTRQAGSARPGGATPEPDYNHTYTPLSQPLLLMPSSDEDGQIDEDGRESSLDPEASAAMKFIRDALNPPEPNTTATLKPEWTSAHHSPIPSLSPERSLCRLVVLSSTVVPTHQNVAVVERHDIVKIGRDRQPEPQIRLKEMAVSKHHAYIYWDEASSAWGLVDCGSVHGTFVRSSLSESNDPERLSPPRSASVPRILHDRDIIEIGASQFTVHVHPSGNPCNGCADDDKNTIPLLPIDATKPHTDPTSKSSHISRNQRETPKQALKSLKASLLRPTHRLPTPSTSTSEDKSFPTQYIDRSKKRRERFGTEEVPTSQLASESREKRPRYEDPRAASIMRAAVPPASQGPSSSLHALHSFLRSA